MLLLVLAVGCTHDVHVRYPAAPDAPTGRLVLLLSQPASNVSVAINGLLVVEDAHTKKVVIDDVPAGSSEVVLAANGADKSFRAWVDGINPTTIPLGVPDGSVGMVKSLIGTLVTIVAYSLLH
ncbi:MAG TPA: hypothetical protein VFQ53_32150 [Kofleriaceae bacterium]|nr:hypothetical protein [Kofleriaceae bacterium]